MSLSFVQFWTCRCARTLRTLTTRLRFPMRFTPTQDSGVPKPDVWRSASSPGPVLHRSDSASTRGALSQPEVGAQLAHVAQIGRTLLDTTLPRPIPLPAVTPSPRRTVTPLPSKQTLPETRTPPPRLIPFPPRSLHPVRRRVPPTVHPRCPRSALRR